MTTLLTHTVSHSTRHSFCLKTSNHPIKVSLQLSFFPKRLCIRELGFSGLAEQNKKQFSVVSLKRWKLCNHQLNFGQYIVLNYFWKYWLGSQWRKQQNACRNVNWRTYEHQHFERILLSWANWWLNFSWFSELLYENTEQCSWSFGLGVNEECRKLPFGMWT